MGILEGKNVLVAGVTMNTSIGYRVAELAQAEGANVVVSNFGRAMGITARVLKRLDPVPPLIELDADEIRQLLRRALDRAGEVRCDRVGDAPLAGLEGRCERGDAHRRRRVRRSGP